jgi:hypothetical protein
MSSRYPFIQSPQMVTLAIPLGLTYHNYDEAARQSFPIEAGRVLFRRIGTYDILKKEN